MAHSRQEETDARTNGSANLSASPRLALVSVGVGLVAFLATEIMHYLLVPDIGRVRERLLAEGVSAVIVALLTARLMYIANQRREAALVRMQVVSEMNHHIRNALAAISLTAESLNNQQCIRVISESVDRIEWTLREILLLRKPLKEKDLDRLRYFQSPSGGPAFNREEQIHVREPGE
ncbi:MAG TPA: histidine kinase dimerization/phospho-acceptor domain-containing protein [Candidatus Sulfotelmatobacter sp.]